MKRKQIVIDPGHGGSDPGGMAGRLVEKDLNLDISRRVADKLAAYEAEVLFTRQGDTTVGLKERADIANSGPAGFFLSIHCNSGGGEGFESYVHPGAPAATLNIREKLHREVARFALERNIADRGMKAANFAVLRLAKMPAVLLETLFIDHPRDAELLRDHSFLNDLTAAISLGVAAALDLAPKVPGEIRTPAKVPADTRPAQARLFLAGKNPAAPDYVDMYVSMEQRYGIRWDAVFAQSCKETAFWKFGGLVKPEQNNFAGLGAFGGNPGAGFRTPAEGIEAQFQHWHVYYYGGDLPAGSIPLDPRRDAVLKSGWAGRLEYVEDLGGRWAPGPDYGVSIVRDYLTPMKNTAVPEPPAPPWNPQQEIDNLKKAGLIVSDHNPEDFVTWGELATVLNRIMAKGFKSIE
ncbi:MAG: N-acetylmuramoyl-L-alanine amidase [Bacillota bacterium]